MAKVLNTILTKLSPILGAGAVGACPLCWVGSASLLTYLGLGSLIPIWRNIAFTLLGIAVAGFLLDYRAHRVPYPSVLLISGGILLYLGRYVYGGAGFADWQIWGLGAALVVAATIYNKRLFRKPQTKS